MLEPQGDVITVLKEGIVLTLVTFRGARDSRLHVSVWGMPYTERYCFRPAEIRRPEIHGRGKDSKNPPAMAPEDVCIRACPHGGGNA